MGTRGKVLITGGQGTVGKFLASRLPFDILNPGRNELDLFNIDQVSNYLTEHKIDTVVHCALTGRENLFSQDPIYTTDGLWMFRNLWNNKDKFNKFINLGTAYEFDLTQNNLLIKEADVKQHLPNTSYGYAKNIISRICLDTLNFYNLRLFGVFHEEEANHRFFKKILINKTIDIHNDIYMDYMYLGDIIPMINKIVSQGSDHKDINMVYKNKYRMSELAKLFCNVHGIDPTNINILGNNNLNLTGSSTNLDMNNFNYIGLEEGFRLYKI